MKRPLGTTFTVAAALCTLLSLGCTENPSGVKDAPSSPQTLVIAPTQTLDQSVGALLALFPNGQATAGQARWTSIKRKYADGLTDPGQLAVAKKMLVELTEWIQSRAQGMSDPPAGETRNAAASRLVLYMAMYVYQGPQTPAPSFVPSADNAIGIVTPAAGATIVTPTTHAGIQLEAGSVAENTIIVITENPNHFTHNCSGPLATRLCQYPEFYSFDEFPHARFLKPAKINVCHVNSGDVRRPLADHDRFRPAHTKPADPADYTPGSTIRDQDGENIEILPLVSQDFSTCTGSSYTVALNGLAGALTKFASAIARRLAPDPAYAIDLGLGGSTVSLSDFNDVDPLGRPDLSVQDLTLASQAVRPADTLHFRYTISNSGTATSSAVSIVLIPSPGNFAINLPAAPPLAPGEQVSLTFNFRISGFSPTGSYTFTLRVGSDPLFADANTENNARAVGLTVEGPLLMHVCNGGDERTLTTNNLAFAVSQVADGGTIRICDGSFRFHQIGLGARSLTIEAEGPGIPTIDGEDSSQIFYLDSPTPTDAVVTLRNLRLVNGHYGNVSVQNHYGSLLIDRVEFHPSEGRLPSDADPDLSYASGVGAFNAIGKGVTVQNSTFIGGDIGVLMGNTQNVVVVNNTFVGQLNAALHGADGGSLVAANNTISQCGHRWCIGMFNNAAPANVRILNNNITVDFARPTAVAVQLHNGVYEIRGNVISGVGGTRNDNPLTWPINEALSVSDGSNAIVSGNRISGAYVGIYFRTGTAALGTDNDVSAVSQGLRSFGAGAVSITRSNFTNYTTPIDTDSPAAIATCNWWGSASGPVVAPWIASTTYSPWATAPIANQAGVSCGT